MLERRSATGIPRNQLKWTLSVAHIVPEYRRIDECMLCRNDRVNEAGLCDVCYAMLNGEEQKLAEAWMNGIAP